MDADPTHRALAWHMTMGAPQTTLHIDDREHT